MTSTTSHKGTAVDDEDPKASPMDKPKPAAKPEADEKGRDLPGADGALGAGAEEDTYD